MWSHLCEAARRKYAALVRSRRRQRNILHHGHFTILEMGTTCKTLLFQYTINRRMAKNIHCWHDYEHL
ncbi:hypothetical protein XELAEV_18042401mg [Xenopus laevis]|uniref:Uncharacterized protein n=1 Tax=Xenopus laevis TaxID=8355 RepID=A0A974C476_XENLA|nr:hypothetical protein XELAEV_18042401mg [Xenopus laevis]